MQGHNQHHADYLGVWGKDISNALNPACSDAKLGAEASQTIEKHQETTRSTAIASNNYHQFFCDED